jgi:hypothetical protein
MSARRQARDTTTSPVFAAVKSTMAGVAIPGTARIAADLKILRKAPLTEEVNR